MDKRDGERDGEMLVLKCMGREGDDIYSESMRIIAQFKECAASPYVVACHGAFVWSDDAVVMMVMNFCDAGSVLDLMCVGHVANAEISLSEQLIRVVLKQVLHGLVHIHSKGMTHVNIKVANIMVDHRGNCKLADFGVRWDIKAAPDRLEWSAPDMHWTAPEIIKSYEPPYDCTADIWSLGITAIEMATGCPPNAGKDYWQVITTILRDEPPSLPDDANRWSEDFRDFISSCLAKDPKMRPSARELIQHSWMYEDGDNDVRALQSLRKWIRNRLPMLKGQNARLRKRWRDAFCDARTVSL